jgi:hypothetical protein
MGVQVTNNPEALRMLFTEDIYLLQEPDFTYSSALIEPLAGIEPVAPVEPVAEIEMSTEVEATEPVAEIEVVVSPEPSFAYKGLNARNILILVYDEVNEVTTPEGREVLKNIVKSKDLSGNDFALVNYAAYPTASFEALSTFFNSKIIFAFGVSPLQLGLDDYPIHRLIEHQGVQVIFSADLHQMSSEKALKIALWACLKEMQL